MKQVRVVTIIIFAVLILCGITAGQSRTRPKPKPLRSAPVPIATPAPAKHAVTVKLKQGDAVSGYFLRADAEVVQIEVKGGSRAIRLSEIESLAFTPDEAPAAKPAAQEAAASQPPAAPDPVLTAGRRAYTALRKLSDAAQMNLPYVQYANLLIEVRPVVDESLRALPEGAVKAEIAEAMDAFKDAGQACGMIQTLGALPIAAEPGATLMRKYAIKPAVNQLGQEDRLMPDVTLATIWAAANAHMNNLAPLLKL